MTLNDIESSINEWTNWANENENYDIALLKIWIVFEKYLGEVFLNYSLGNPSEQGGYPQLKLQFEDENHFNAFMMEGTKKYIDYISKIEKLSQHSFRQNPFDIFLSDGDKKNKFAQLRALRNYIAHESGESKRKITSLIFNNNESRFVEPKIYLKNIPRGSSKSYYTIYTECISEIARGINIC